MADTSCAPISLVAETPLYQIVDVSLPGVLQKNLHLVGIAGYLSKDVVRRLLTFLHNRG
jgi:hypothetical protein